MIPQPPQRPLRSARPTGVVLAAVALGLAAAFLVLLGVFTLFGAAIGSPATAGLPASSAAVTTAVGVVFAFIYFGLAGWSTGTLVGLLRMRAWARVSAIVIASCVVGFGLLGALGSLAVPAVFRSGQVPLPPGLNLHLLHTVCVAMAVFSLVLAAAGVGAIIYFVQRRVVEAFVLAKVQPEGRASAYSSLAAAPPNSERLGWPARRAVPEPYRDPLTDFTVARPLDPPAPTPESDAPQAAVSDAPHALTSTAGERTPQSQPYAEPGARESVPAWQPSGDSATRRNGSVPHPPHSARPVSITVLSILALTGALVTLLNLVSPYPAFLFGFWVTGMPAHLYVLVWAAALAIAGLGMLRLQRPAWVLSFVLLGNLVLQQMLLLLPSARHRYLTFMQGVTSPGGLGGRSPFPPEVFATMLLFGAIFGISVSVALAVVLWRARAAFTPEAQPAPASPNG